MSFLARALEWEGVVASFCYLKSQIMKKRDIFLKKRSLPLKPNNSAFISSRPLDAEKFQKFVQGQFCEPHLYFHAPFRCVLLTISTEAKHSWNKRHINDAAQKTGTRDRLPKVTKLLRVQSFATVKTVFCNQAEPTVSFWDSPSLSSVLTLIINHIPVQNFTRYVITLQSLLFLRHH